MKLSTTAWIGVLLALIVAGCSKSSSTRTPKEPEITGSPSDPPVELIAKWQPGRRYMVRMEVNQTESRISSRTNAPAQETIINHEFAITATNAPTEGQRWLEVEIRTIEFQLSSGDKILVNYDSLSKVATIDDTGIYESLDRLIGGRIRYLISADNKILRTEGVRELLNRADAPSTNTMAAVRGSSSRRRAVVSGMAGVRRFFSEDSFKQLIEMSSMPQRAIRIGEQWTLQRDLSLLPAGRIQLTATNTLRGWQMHEEKNCARIDVLGTLTGRIANQSTSSVGVTRLSAGRISGRSWFDPAVGLPVESTMEQSYVLNSNVSRRRQGTNVTMQSISNPVRHSVSIKLLEVIPLAK